MKMDTVLFHYNREHYRLIPNNEINDSLHNVVGSVVMAKTETKYGNRHLSVVTGHGRRGGE